MQTAKMVAASKLNWLKMAGVGERTAKLDNGTSDNTSLSDTLRSGALCGATAGQMTGTGDKN
jgi:hypothetical protein